MMVVGGGGDDDYDDNDDELRMHHLIVACSMRGARAGHDGNQPQIDVYVHQKHLIHIILSECCPWQWWMQSSTRPCHVHKGMNHGVYKPMHIQQANA